MKINVVTARFHPCVGGVETRILSLMRYFVKRGHEAVIHTTTIGPQGQPLSSEGEVNGIKIIRYKPRFNLGYFISYWRPKIDEGDLIDLQGYPALYNDSTVRRYKQKNPITYTPHGLSLPTKNSYQAFMRATYDRFFGLKSLRASQIIITMSDDEKNWCRSHGLLASKCRNLPSGVESTAFKETDPSNVKDKFDLEDYILFIGRIHPEKAPIHLLKAFARVKDRTSGIKLVFTGPDAGEAKHLMAEAKHLSLENRIVLTGTVSEKDKRSLLSGSQFFVLPSYFEAQGIVFIEAWAQKKAVIGSKVGGVPYLITDGETGLLYDYGDIEALTEHINYLLENPEKAIEMGKRGFDIAYRNYRWAVIVERMEDIYSEVVKQFRQ